MNQPPYLKKGDKIAITCPAKILKAPITDAIKLLESWGLEVVLGKTIDAVHHQFSGTDDVRAADMQDFINNESIKAIIAARGGYGCIRIIDKIDWTPLVLNPKWIIGFSDITVFHMQLQAMSLQSLHAQMPSTVKESSKESLETLRKALFGESFKYIFKYHKDNKLGTASGELIGGNLTLLTACINAVNDLDYTNKILFIEDIGEYPYVIDRMIRTLDRADKFKNLKGLIVGGFTDIKHNEPSFGYTINEIINTVIEKYDFPVCFNFPAGHISDNKALIFGKQVEMKIGSEESEIYYL
ncbi:S66 peptidase family protein [Pedobacter alpinus]|uniref:LD-carboxypeptidase n=1 Tax=Pedobacter alpinus TaxID=1590643 RepID=A0ABW5TMS1_9SPHI